MGPTALLPLRRKACWGLFRPKNPTALAEFEPTNLGTKVQHATNEAVYLVGCFHNYITMHGFMNVNTDTASRLYVYLFPLMQLKILLLINSLKLYCHQRVIIRSCSSPLSSSTKLLLVFILFHACYTIHVLYPILLLLLTLQPTVGFSLLSDFLPLWPFFTLLSPPSYSHYLQIFFNACNPSLPWSPSSSRTYRFPL